MLKKRTIKKDHLIPFLRKLAKGSRLIAPVKNSRGDVIYQEIHSINHQEIDLSTQPQESAKAFLLPQHDCLYSYGMSEEGLIFKPADSTGPMVLFGLRSCDVSAILYMDVIFLRGPKDRRYLRRRSETILVSIGCNEPFQNCFCNNTRSGPFLELGFDLQLTDLGDRYFVESGRTKGDALLERWPQFFRPVTEEDERLRYQLVLEARSSFRRQVHVDTAFQRMEQEGVPDAVWRYLAERCDGCGGCAHICPTCTCFTIFDRPKGDRDGERIRTWDSCTHLGFTVMAGGANPVDPAVDRLKRRFLHKLYHDYKQFKRPGCVGCGRCLDMCFGGIDIALFVEMVCSDHSHEPGSDPAGLLGKILVEAGLLDEHRLREAMKKRQATGRSLGRILVEEGAITNRDLAQAIERFMERRHCGK